MIRKTYAQSSKTANIISLISEDEVNTALAIICYSRNFINNFLNPISPNLSKYLLLDSLKKFTFISQTTIVSIFDFSVDGALSGQVLLMIYSYRTRRADSEYMYSSRSKRSSQGHVKVKV